MRRVWKKEKKSWDGKVISNPFSRQVSFRFERKRGCQTKTSCAALPNQKNISLPFFVPSLRNAIVKSESFGICGYCSILYLWAKKLLEYWISHWCCSAQMAQVFLSDTRDGLGLVYASVSRRLTFELNFLSTILFSCLFIQILAFVHSCWVVTVQPQLQLSPW